MKEQSSFGNPNRPDFCHTRFLANLKDNAEGSYIGEESQRDDGCLRASRAIWVDSIDW